jgi:hypothetical protein
MKKFIDGKEYRYQDPKTLIDDHEFVDLGLPSKILWASKNIGAERVNQLGSFFCWGETKPAKSRYGNKWYNYKFVRNPISDEEAMKVAKKYYLWQNKPESELKLFAEMWKDDCAKRSIGKYTYNEGSTRGDLKSKLDKIDDAAAAIWGGRWHMPSKDDFEELIRLCDWDWTTIDGIQGAIVIGPNGNSIFLPGERYVDIWTNTLGAANHRSEHTHSYAFQLSASNEEVKLLEQYRTHTANIRPICKK